MHRSVRTFVFLLLALPAMPQTAPDKGAVHYTARVTVPRWPHPATVTIKYDDLFPGKRSAKGGCYFMDMTQPGSPMPLVEDKPDHVTIRAPRGHEIEWHCNWNTK